MANAKWLGVGTLLLTVVGCGSSGGLTEGTGRVHYEGEPLTSGSVLFVGADGTRSHSTIGEKGQYLAQGVAKGTARISVVSHSRVPAGLRKPGAGEAAVQDKKAVEIPKRYPRPEDSGLSVEVRG